MKLSLKQNRLQVFLALTAVSGLLLLFVKAQPVDPADHNQVVSNIAELQAKDTEIGEAVLQLHYRMANNYDAVTALMQRVDRLGVLLEQQQKRGLLPDTPKARSEMNALRLQIAQRDEQLNEFKSNNAVMKNSLIYLPSMVADVLEKLPKSDEALLEKFEFLLRDALLVSVKGDTASISQLEADIARVELLLPVLPENVRTQATYVARHARTLLEVDRVMPGLLVQLSAYQGGHLGAGLDRLYQEHYQQQQRTAEIYRLFLLLAAMLMLGYSIYVYYRLKVQRQQLIDALAEINNQQHALNEHAIVSITDVKGDITYVNDKFMKISGYSAEELLGHNHRMVQSGFHDKEFFRNLWQTVANGHVWHGQVKNKAKNGSYYWVEATVVPFMNQAGKPYQYVSMRTDITAQKNMEQQIAADRSLLQNVMDTLGEGVYMLDLHGKCTYLNREAENITGWRSEELLGRSLHDLIHSRLPDGTQVAEVDCPVHKSMLARRVYRSETDYFQHKNGTLFPVSIVASPMLEGGEVVGSVAAFQDVSERKFTERELLRAKEAAEAASRAKGDFLATMSHEIRTPMNGIIGMTELALDTELNAEQREYLSMVKSSADALLTIINDILDFSKIESGKLELERVEFDVRTLFSHAEKALALRAVQKGVELVYDVDSEIPDMLIGDPGRIRQVLTNLLGNAIKFSDYGAVTLRMKLLRQYSQTVRVRIEVADQGIGIPAEKQAHIFEAFTQADASTTRKYGGTGLGLAISSRLVTAMGGKLTVESEVGAGSVFGFDIDLPTGPLSAPSSTALKGLSALIVDDNATNRHFLRQLLDKWGVRSESVSSARDALERLSQAGAFDLLLLDAMMPDMDGFELAEKIRGSDIKRGAVVMLSSAGYRINADRYPELGVDAYLNKPIDRNELFGVIKGVMGIRTEVATPVMVQQQAQPLMILLAEDNRVNQKLAITLLEKWGHRVVLANNGIEAVAQARQQHLDLILMDLQMPEMGGLEATRLIREHEASMGIHTPIIAMTANAMSEDRQRCLDAGMDDYMAKPLKTEILRDKLLGLLSEVTEQPACPVEEAFDYVAALERGDAWVIETIGQAFLEECDPQMDQIAAAIAAKDKAALMRGAHTLRGLVGNFNAHSIENTARQMEQLAERGEISGTEILFVRMQDQMRLLKAALVAYLGSDREG